MPFCAKCGSSVGEGAAFCPSCGSTVGSSAAPAASSAPVAAAPVAAGTSGIEENVAGLLCYALWWLSGVIFYIIDKRPFVRFHAAQSITLFGCICVGYVAAGFVVAIGAMTAGFAGLALSWLLYGVLNIAAFVLWIFLMVKAYGGQKFRVPLVADLAEKIFGVS